MLYLNLIQDLPKEIGRVAEFLGKELTENRLISIVEHCTFKSMRKNPNATYDGLHNAIDTKKTTFLRRGNIIQLCNDVLLWCIYILRCI